MWPTCGGCSWYPSAARPLFPNSGWPPRLEPTRGVAPSALVHAVLDLLEGLRHEVQELDLARHTLGPPALMRPLHVVGTWCEACAPQTTLCGAARHVPTWPIVAWACGTSSPMPKPNNTWHHCMKCHRTTTVLSSATPNYRAGALVQQYPWALWGSYPRCPLPGPAPPKSLATPPLMRVHS